jgi:hypothetical protein
MTIKQTKQSEKLVFATPANPNQVKLLGRRCDTQAIDIAALPHRLYTSGCCDTQATYFPKFLKN